MIAKSLFYKEEIRGILPEEILLLEEIDVIFPGGEIILDKRYNNICNECGSSLGSRTAGDLCEDCHYLINFLGVRDKEGR